MEVLKEKFGESLMFNANVMIKDMADSRRIALNHQPTEMEDVTFAALVVSNEYWPKGNIMQCKMPEKIQKYFKIHNSAMISYSESFEGYKTSRELVWCHNLGVVDLDLKVGDVELNFKVTPIQASLVMLFTEKCYFSI
jgi:anaphase-promoting complex subunit 2